MTPAPDIMKAARECASHLTLFPPSDREPLEHKIATALQSLRDAERSAAAAEIERLRAEREPASAADIDIALRKLRMESHVTGAPGGLVRLIDDILLSCMPMQRLAEILTDVVAQRIQQSEPDEGQKDAGSTPANALGFQTNNAVRARIRELAERPAMDDYDRAS
jgi:hypothetical protein